MDGGLVSRTLVCGVGVNDSDYKTTIMEELTKVGGKRARKLIWRCPFYTTWKGMVMRCYSETYQKKRPTYVGCTVSEDWLLFSNFKSWMEGQNWEGMVLDKDVLFVGNKHYSPETCVFITPKLNSFLLECGSRRGELPIGVRWSVRDKAYYSECSNPFGGRDNYLGVFACPLEAHQAWLKRKLEHARTLAAEQDDPRVAEALIRRYTNYQPTTLGGSQF